MTDKTILIITHKEDYTSDFVINKLNQRNIKYKRFNCEDIINKNYKIDNNFKLEFDGETNFGSVWFRRTKLPNIEYQNPTERAYLLSEYESLLKNLFSTIDAKWLSNPFCIYQAENKLYQLKVAKNLGFKTPNTLVTNSKEDLKTFYFNNSKNVVIKPLSQSRINNSNETEYIFTNILKEQHIEELDKFDLTPCIFQEKIEKSIELRVTVVGENVFTAGVNSQILEATKTDWRKEKLEFYTEEIPNEIKEKCIALVKILNLRFGAIDLIKDKEGNYIFLEINPNGQWAWIENETGLEISDSIINELLC
jgi:glutathione synthase/RimK-type ligase-like ATP-grasp enzyme